MIAGPVVIYIACLIYAFTSTRPERFDDDFWQQAVLALGTLGIFISGVGVGSYAILSQ